MNSALLSLDSVLGTAGLDFASPAAFLSSPSMMVGQMTQWLPIWATPLYAIAISLLLGAVISIVFYAILAGLSFIPPLGKLADSSQRGVIASLVVGGVIAGFLCWQYVPGAGQYAGSLYLPLIAAGLVVGFATVYGMWHRTRVEWAGILSEGVSPYLLAVAGSFVVIGLIGSLWVATPMEFLRAIPEVHLVGDGTRTETLRIPPASESADGTFFKQDVQYDLTQLAEVTLLSDRTITIGDAADPADFTRPPTKVQADEKLSYRYEDRDTPPLPADSSKLFIQNQEVDEALVTMTFQTVPRIPQAVAFVSIAVGFFLMIAALVSFRQAAPRVWALALSTAKNEMAQMLYLILMILGVVGVVVFSIYPFNTLGDDIRMFKDSSVTLIMVLGMGLAVWSAGTSVSDEIEGRTALTVLSKPVSRRSFLLGKYAGIMMSVLVLFAVISTFMLILMSYKPIYDARESSLGTPMWQQGFEEIMATLPILGLYFMQTMVIAAIAVALATRVPLLANFITCLVIYVIGNLTQPLVASSQGNNELVAFVGNLIAVVVPNLNVFNVQSAMDAGNQVPIIYVAGAFNYLVYFAIAIWMLAMLLFEDRDLA
ncbi:ABC transporter permease [Stieleria varia]|uniref:ABC-2 family transporter protein n=1 Tax=Stieleria varia TaxID=2528005 RepID=A0A5C5ZY29_9BACT|nr:ABC transporter permease [Stieleria varia]TWT92070.1 ABC-2 family transporter protein [Stieleria varia]